ncbi:hypothetical protein THARTR1_01566 [Trichoderma harzianum]|uniref:Uncharacterized protein n=1 Tax=Trichoderma harzianum TaxID=5544 RepID=A0A2K0ULA0_TRIHA|nr:hypothetical protein THARTR1_01566 [Trichoderma harzianum]
MPTHIRLTCRQSLFFLVPDDQLQAVRDLAIDVGLSPADEDILRLAYPCEMSRLAVRFLIDESTCTEGPLRRRLVFTPMSWTGITREEIVSPSAKDGSQKNPPIPSFIQTVPLSVACAALVRIAIRQNRSSRLRTNVIENLSSFIPNGLFDMSYDGEYMELPPDEQPL